jgi:voltage-gated sodium channel
MVGGNVAFLRLLRLMRLLKLVGKVKQLSIIVNGLGVGLSSVSYILLLLLLIFYVFAILGVSTFRKNDPFHYGGLGVAMVSLFRIATLEAWSNDLGIASYGCKSQNIFVDGVNALAQQDKHINQTKRGSSQSFCVLDLLR